MGPGTSEERIGVSAVFFSKDLYIFGGALTSFMRSRAPPTPKRRYADTPIVGRTLLACSGQGPGT